MPKYFLHIRSEGRLIPDEEGAELRDLSEARKLAVQGARDLLAEKLRTGEPLDGDLIEITDVDGRVLNVLRFRDVFGIDPAAELEWVQLLHKTGRCWAGGEAPRIGREVTRNHTGENSV
jgi:hypothetical protein